MGRVGRERHRDVPGMEIGNAKRRNGAGNLQPIQLAMIRHARMR